MKESEENLVKIEDTEKEAFEKFLRS